MKRWSRKIWICNDVWMDILPFFDHAQLGLKWALISPRFDVLVGTHFDDKTTELTLCRPIIIHFIESELKMSVRHGHNYMHFPLPDRPMPNKIRFKSLHIHYINPSVITFLHANKQIFDGKGTKLELDVWPYGKDVQPIWDDLAHQILPIFATNIRHLRFTNGAHLDNLCRRISPTILSDLKHLCAINSGFLCPDVLLVDDFDGPNATLSAGQSLAKWLHTPTTNGQPKELRCPNSAERNSEWVNNFKEVFVRARTSSVSYTVHFNLHVETSPIVPFELVNEWTKEKLTLKKMSRYDGDEWLLKRCPIIGGKNDENSDANLNNVRFEL